MKAWRLPFRRYPRCVSGEGGFIPRDAESQRILKILSKFLAQPTIQNCLLSLRQYLKPCRIITLSKSLNWSVTIESVKDLDLTRLQRTLRKQEFNETLKAAPMSQHYYISRLLGFWRHNYRPFALRYTLTYWWKRPTYAALWREYWEARGKW